MPSDLSLFHHQYIDNQTKKTLILLHGTGGDETDFLFLNDPLNDKYNLLALRGNVQENGSNRFFKRLAHGVFDQGNLRTETQKMKDFITAWLKKHHQTADDLVFFGYSNGANMILATLFYYPEIVKTAVVLHPMLPFEFKNTAYDFASHHLFVTHGTLDAMVTPTQWQELFETLQALKTKLVIKEYPGAHGLSSEEVRVAVEFMKERN